MAREAAQAAAFGAHGACRGPGGDGLWPDQRELKPKGRGVGSETSSPLSVGLSACSPRPCFASFFFFYPTVPALLSS